MAVARRAVVLAAVAHVGLNTGIDDTSVSLLQMRVERIHNKPHHNHAAVVKNVSEEHISANDTTTSDGIWSMAQNTIQQIASKAEQVLYRQQNVHAKDGSQQNESAHQEHSPTESPTTIHEKSKAVEQTGEESGTTKTKNSAKTSAVVKDIMETQKKKHAESGKNHGDVAMGQRNHVLKGREETMEIMVNKGNDEIKERHSAMADAAELAHLTHEVKALQHDEEVVSKQVWMTGHTLKKGSNEHASEEHAGEEHAGEEHASKEHASKEHAGEEHAGEEHTGEEHAGKEHNGKEHNGKEHNGKEHNGKEHNGKEHNGKEHAGEEHARKEHVSKEHVAKEHSGKERVGKEHAGKEEYIGEEDRAKKHDAREHGAKEHKAKQHEAKVQVSRAHVATLATKDMAKAGVARDNAAKERAATERAAEESLAKERAAKERVAEKRAAKEFAAKEFAAKEFPPKDLSAKDLTASKTIKPALVRFTGNDLAKRAVHLEEKVSQKEFGNQKQDIENTNEFPKQIGGQHNLISTKLDASSGRSDQRENLERYHPGSKLYELEGGDYANKPQPERNTHLNSSDLSKAKKHTKRPSVVSDAMEEAFGDADPALGDMMVGQLETAQLHTISEESIKSDGRHDRNAHGNDFWGKEKTSEIAREFTVEGIPMTSVLDKEESVLDRVDSQKVKGQGHSRMKTDTANKVLHKSTHEENHIFEGSETDTAHEVLHKATHEKKHAIEGSKKDGVGVTDTVKAKGHMRTIKDMSEVKVLSASSHLSHADMCEISTSLDFSATIVSHNNLGGQGPDTGDETLVYSGITNKNGFAVDLVISATSSYTPRDASKNGLQDSFGLINLEINSAVDLLFRFVSDGQPIVMDSFYFTFFDLDQGMAHQAREKVTIRGFNSYELSEDSSLDTEELGESSAIFSSSMRGGKVDNPISPMSLSHMQRERSVVATFSGVSEFSVQLSEENYASSQGRNWFFAGPSSLVCSREAKCSAYDCPSGYHVRTMGEFLLCAGSECTEDDTDTCCYEVVEDEDVEDEDAEDEDADDDLDVDEAEDAEYHDEDAEDEEDIEDNDGEETGEEYNYDINSVLYSKDSAGKKQSKQRKGSTVESKHHSETSGAEGPRQGMGMGMGKSTRQ